MPSKEYSKSIKEAKYNSKQDFLTFKNTILPKLQSKVIPDSGVFQTKSIFVGEYGYPSVNVGVLSTTDFSHHEDIPFWVKEQWSLSQIAEKRIDLINAKSVVPITQPKDISEKQEIALSKKPVQAEISLQAKGKSFAFSKYHMPIGPSRDLEKLFVSENIHVDTRVEKVISDTDLRASEGLHLLYKKGFRPEYLTQALTSGSLGINRKLVPSKWGITAVDDTLGKELLVKVRELSQTGNLVFEGNYMGNYFIILLYDGLFSYELIELFRDVAKPTTDFEHFTGRKNYAKNTAGGYYAARLPIVEWMISHKRQAKALVIRFITDEYYMPLGVWVVREAVTKTMNSKPLEFGSEELMFSYLLQVAKKKFNRDLSWLTKKSKLLQEHSQLSLHSFK